MDFIKKYVGIGWLIFILIISILITITTDETFFIKISLFIGFVIFAILGIMIVNCAKPEAIITTGGFFSLLWAKLFWNIVAPILGIICTPIIALHFYTKITQLSPSEQAQQDLTIYCSTEQIAKTGMKKCETVKQEYVKILKTDLAQLKQNLKNAKAETKSLTNDKKNKCSEKGLQEYGSIGCDTATTELDENKEKITNLSAEIESLEKKIKELKSAK